MSFVDSLRTQPGLFMATAARQSAVKVVRAREMAAIDKHTIEDLGVPGAVLMENAGRQMAYAILRRYPKLKSCLIFCGPGNNGGDGYVIGRTLLALGVTVGVVALKDWEALPPDARLHAHAYLQAGGEYHTFSQVTNLHVLAAPYELLVDSLLGTGLTRPLGGQLQAAVLFLQGYAALRNDGSFRSKPIVGVDVPSGICSDTGQVLGCAVPCDVTLTVGLPKVGLLLPPGLLYAGEVEVLEIGFAPALLQAASLPGELITRKLAQSLVPSRSLVAHKGSLGTTLVVAGSPQYTGAPILASGAALRVGSGLVLLAACPQVMARLGSSLPELLLMPLADEASEEELRQVLGLEPEQALFTHRPTSLCLGPGLSRSPQARRKVHFILSHLQIPCVVDADALYHLAQLLREGLLAVPAWENHLILTPHQGEMATLLGCSVEQVRQDLLGAALSCCETYQAVVVLKGNPTIVAAMEDGVVGYAVNTTGGPILAQAGSGDVLAGMIAGLVAQGLTPLSAARLGVYWHGLVGDYCARELGPSGVPASELAQMLPKALASLCSNDSLQ